MVRIVNGNSELRVNEADLAAYLEKGYAVISDGGQVFKPKKVYSYAELVLLCEKQERAIRRHDAYVAETDAKIAKKDAEIVKLKAEIKRLNPIIDAEPAKTSAETPKVDSAATEAVKKKTAQSAK